MNAGDTVDIVLHGRKLLARDGVVVEVYEEEINDERFSWEDSDAATRRMFVVEWTDSIGVLRKGTYYENEVRVPARFSPIPALLATKAGLLKAQLLSSSEEDKARYQASIDGLDQEIEKLRRREARRTAIAA